MQISLAQDDDDLRFSLDRHLSHCDASIASISVSGGGKRAVGEIREAHGLCPSCGQQLYKIEEVQAGIFSCCLGEDDDSNVRKVPLTIPQLVERGQCLICKETGVKKSSCGSVADTISTYSSYDDEEDTTGSWFFAHTPNQMEREAPYTSSPTTTATSTLKPPPPPATSGTLKAPPPGSVTETPLEEERFVQQSALAAAAWLPAGTAVYRGPYNEKGERHGEGEMVWSNGDVYRGSFVRDNRHGHGTLNFASPFSSAHADGGEYVGDWKLDAMNGAGTRRYPNGDVYMGEYCDGVRSGEGRFYYANGDLYWGQWQNNQMHGEGRYYYASGQRFEGSFQNGRRSGKGKLQRTDGTLEIFQYVNDQRVGQGVRWSPDRTRAWRLWIPSSNGAPATTMEKQKMTVAEAVSLVYDIEQAADEFQYGN